MTALQRIGQWILAMVLAVAAGLKLAGLLHLVAPPDPQAAKSLFETLPPSGQWIMVITELALAAWLANGWRPRLGAFAAITLLSVFLAVVLIEMGKPVPRDCGCMGNLTHGHLAWTVALDGALLAVALGVYYAALCRKQTHL